VGVERRAQGARRERVLDQAEGAAGRLAGDHEADTEGEQVHDFTLVRTEQVADRCLHLGPILSIDVLSIES
jgi:hypothetical protein